MMVITATMILAKMKSGYVIGAFIVILQMITIDNPAISRSQQEKEEAIQNLSKDIISLFALLYVASSLPTKIHKAHLRAELKHYD